MKIDPFSLKNGTQVRVTIEGELAAGSSFYKSGIYVKKGGGYTYVPVKAIEDIEVLKPIYNPSVGDVIETGGGYVGLATSPGDGGTLYLNRGLWLLRECATGPENKPSNATLLFRLEDALKEQAPPAPSWEKGARFKFGTAEGCVIHTNHDTVTTTFNDFRLNTFDLDFLEVHATLIDPPKPEYKPQIGDIAYCPRAEYVGRVTGSYRQQGGDHVLLNDLSEYLVKDLVLLRRAGA